MTYGKVQYNLKYILWSKLYVGLVSVITSSEVYCSILLTPHYPAVRQEGDGCCHALCVQEEF